MAANSTTMTSMSSTTVTSSLVINPITAITTVTSSVSLIPSTVAPSTIKRHNTRSSSGSSKVTSSFMKVRVSPKSPEDNNNKESVPSSRSFHYPPAMVSFTENATDDDDKTPTPSPQHLSYVGKELERENGALPTTQHPPTAKLPHSDMPSKDDRIETLIAQNAELFDRVIKLEHSVEFVMSMLHVKDCVINGIQGELRRLQQYTRRYSVSIAGIPKPRTEKREDLRAQVEEIINLANSETTPDDIDKLHRNGRIKDGEQSTIVRFRSHAAKEAFYKARKNLPASHRHIKIRPSLSPEQNNLLHDAQEFLENFDFTDKDGDNPPEFVFANIHGLIQVKMKKPTKQGLFVTINSLDDLNQVITRAQFEQDRLQHHHESEGWADKPETGFKAVDSARVAAAIASISSGNGARKKLGDISEASLSPIAKKADGEKVNSDDDMGFSLFQ